MKKTKNDGYLVFRRKQLLRTRNDKHEVVDYWDKIVGFCNTEKTALELARSIINKDLAKYEGVKKYSVVEVTDDMLTGYVFDECGNLDVYVKDEIYPYLINKLSKTSEEDFIVYIVSIEHYI